VGPRNIYPHEVLFEFRRIGRVVRVAAIDPVTGIEVTMVAPPSRNMEEAKRIAARKLAYVIGKKRAAARKALKGKGGIVA